MPTRTLKKLLKKPDVKVILEHHRTETAQDVLIVDAHGTPLWGEPGADHGFRQPILTGETTLGWLSSPLPALTLVILLESLLKRDLEQKALAQETLDRYKEINLLYSLTERTGKCFGLQEVTRSFVEEARRSLTATSASIMLFDEKSRQLEIVAALGEKSSIPARLSPGEGIAGRIFSSGKAEVINDVTTDERYLSGGNQAKSLICVPLKTSDEVFGVLNISNSAPNQYTAADLKLATMLGSLSATAVENILAQERLLKEQLYSKAMSQDLEIGRKIQGSFFPDRAPAIAGWEVAFRFQSARQVSGDFYDAFCVADCRYLVLVIADVCNKGVGAALFMGLFRSLLRAFADLHFPGGIAPDEGGDAGQRLHRVMMLTNNYIANMHGGANMFATIFLGLVDPQNGEIVYINGGHDAPLILNATGIRCGLAQTGPAVGMFPDMPFEVGRAQLHPQESLLLFTDGVTEAMNAAGELYTEARLFRLLAASCPPPPADTLLQQINEDLYRHIGSAGQSDDITLMCIRRGVGLAAASGKLPATGEESWPRIMEMAAPALRDNLSLFLAFVSDSCPAAGLSKSLCHDLTLCLEEVVLNLIDHGYQKDNPGLIRVRLVREERLVRLCVEDQSPAFDPSGAPRPDLDSPPEERSIGGLGWLLVRQLMDEVTYQAATDGWNLLTLTKFLQPHEERGYGDNRNES